MKMAIKITDEVTGMILKFLAVVFFIVLFLIIAYAIIKDLTRERKRIDGKRKPNQSYNEYNHVYGGNVVPLQKRKKHTKTHSGRDR
jgi:hypothetical protein